MISKGFESQDSPASGCVSRPPASIVGALILVLVSLACAREDERLDLQLDDFVKAYQDRGLFHKRDEKWHGFEHSGARRGVRFVPYADEPEKMLELYEFDSVRERRRSDEKTEEYFGSRKLPFDPGSSVGISRFSLYGHRQFSSERERQLVAVFRSVVANEPGQRSGHSWIPTGRNPRIGCDPFSLCGWMSDTRDRQA